MNESYKLYWHPLSPFSRTVITFMRINNIPFEEYIVDFGKREQRSEAYLKKIPFGTVPALEVTRKGQNPIMISESRAILFYLSRKFPSQLMPINPRSPHIWGIFNFNMLLHSIFYCFCQMTIHTFLLITDGSLLKSENTSRSTTNCWSTWPPPSTFSSSTADSSAKSSLPKKSTNNSIPLWTWSKISSFKRTTFY